MTHLILIHSETQTIADRRNITGKDAQERHFIESDMWKVHRDKCEDDGLWTVREE